MEGAIDRIGLNCFLGQALGFIQTDTPVREHESQIIQNCRVVLLKIKSFPKSLFRIVILFLLFVN